MLELEDRYWSDQIPYVCGVDEAGVGPIAGPLVAAAVIMPARKEFPGIDDSKKLSDKQREEQALVIKQNAVAYSTVIVEPGEIDRINVYHAVSKAMREAVVSLRILPGIVLVDGNREIPDLGIRQHTVVKGDSKSQSIAAASILAKTLRDSLMMQYDSTWPHYRFDRHKGYPTQVHLERVKKHGPCPIHRMSFKPFRDTQIGGPLLSGADGAESS